MVGIVEYVLPGENIQLATNTSAIIVGGKSFSERPPGIAVTEIRKVSAEPILLFTILIRKYV